jgi:phospholipid transport system transporter-binding protein
MLAWQRAAANAGVKLELVNLPAILKSLTKLYGVCALVSPQLCDQPARDVSTSAELHHH